MVINGEIAQCPPTIRWKYIMHTVFKRVVDNNRGHVSVGGASDEAASDSL
jgi:hypothetical protein